MPGVATLDKECTPGSAAVHRHRAAEARTLDTGRRLEALIDGRKQKHCLLAGVPEAGCYKSSCSWTTLR